MAVSGFGAGAHELKDRKMVPVKLTVFRKFRFCPYANEGSPVWAWKHFVDDAGHGPRYAPCLTATYYSINSVYDRPGEYVATCQRRALGGAEHPVPSLSCSCGIWAYYTPDVVDTGTTTEWMALAAVKVWGDVVLGEKGVRAEKMEIVGILPPPEVAETRYPVIGRAWNDVVGKLQVPQFQNKEELLESFPPEDVSELLPKKPEPEPVTEFPRFVNAYERTQILQQYYGWAGLALTGVTQTPWLYAANAQQFSPQQPAASYKVHANPVPSWHYVDPTNPIWSSPMEYTQGTCQVCQYNVISESRQGAEKMMLDHWQQAHIISSSP